MNRRPHCSGIASVEGTSQVRLLIVDAHEITRVGTRVVLDQIAHSTIVNDAATIAAARQILAQHEIDLALLELRFPDGNGIDFCRQIRTLSPCTKVVFLTESIDDALAVSALEAGAVGVLDKTISGRSLVCAIEAVLNGYATIDCDVLQKSITHLFSLSMVTCSNVRTDLLAAGTVDDGTDAPR